MPKITNRVLTAPDQGLDSGKQRNARHNVGITDYVTSAEATASQLKLHFKEGSPVTFSPVFPQPEPGQEYNVLATDGTGMFGWTEGVLEIRDSDGEKISPVQGAVTLPEIPEQVQSDWEAGEGPAAILHKPGIEEAAEGGTAESLVSTGEKYAWNGKQEAIVDLDTIRSGATAGSTAVQPGDMAVTDVAGDSTKKTVTLNGGLSQDVLVAHQDITGKADKSEMSVTQGTGPDADKVTIQLKNNTAATVLTTHQDISNKADKATTLSGYGITDAYTKTETDTLLDGKVDVIEGKGLSSNDYTTEDKGKLSGIETGAQVNVIETVQLNGTAVSPTGKTVNIQLDKSSVGLGNVDNTSDSAKPISTATQSALDSKADKSEIPTNKAAAQGGTDDSLVTTGDKYDWDDWKSSNITIPLPKDTIEVKGHLFKYVRIGNLLVTTENLDIPLGTVGTNCFWYNDDEDTNRDLGMLYKFSALGSFQYIDYYHPNEFVPTKEVYDCIYAQGWRIWTDWDWNTIVQAHIPSGDTTQNAYKNMCATSGWKNSTQGANTLGLNLPPSGERRWDGTAYTDKGYSFVARTIYILKTVYRISPTTSTSDGDLNTGASVRLVKNVTV